MSQLPQNNETLDNSPEYSEPYQENSNGHPSTVASGGQLPPASEFSSSVWKMGPGEKAANLSLIFGVFGMLALALAFWWVSHGFGIGMPIIIAAPLLSLLGLWQARVARQHGEDANVGLLLSGIGIVIVIAIVGFIVMIGFALYGFNDAGPSTSLSALSLR